MPSGRPPRQGPRRGWRPRLRTVLFGSYLLILILPLAGVLMLRVYESVLIRRTESELLIQGAAVAAAYRSELAAQLKLRRGLAAPSAAPREPYGRPLPEALRVHYGSRFQPLLPTLDLGRDPVGPIPPEPRKPARAANAAPVAAGRQLADTLRQLQRFTLAGIRVLDASGVIVATTRGQLGLSLGHWSEVQRALQGQRVSSLRRRQQKRKLAAPLRRYSRMRVYVALPVVIDDRVVGAVLLSRTPSTVRMTLYRRRWLIAALGGAALIALLGLAWIGSRLVSKPVAGLVAQAEQVARGETAELEELPHLGTWEMQRLSRALVTMSRAQRERADYIQTFASNVSHEFKTPLTAIRGAVELLRDHAAEMTDVERVRFLDNLEKDAGRLERLVHRLLELARAEGTDPGDETCKAQAVLLSVVDRYRTQGLELQLEAELDEGVRLAMAEDSLRSVLGALLDNARQHGGAGVQVTIRARPASQGGSGRGRPLRGLRDGPPAGEQLRIEVSDNGQGVSAGNRERIFDRFFTTARERGGSGLGLAIVRALLQAHGGLIELDVDAVRPNRTTFVVEIPIARAVAEA